MKRGVGKSVRDKVVSQGLSKALGATEPDTGRLPRRDHRTNSLRIQPAVLRAHQRMHPRIGRLGVGHQFFDRLGCEINRRVKQVDLLRPRRLRQLFHARDERRDANAGPNPDLTWPLPVTHHQWMMAATSAVIPSHL